MAQTASKDEEQAMDVIITGTETMEMPSVVHIKEEPIDKDVSVQRIPLTSKDGASKVSAETDGDVVYLGTEIVLRYLQGDMSFEEFNTILEAEVKDDPDHTQIDPAQEAVQATDTSIQSTDDTSADEEDRAGASGDSGKEDKKRKRKEGVRRKRNTLPKHAQGLMGEANMRFATGATEDAIKICMEIIKMAPKSPEPYQTLGMIYEETGNSERALQFMLIGAHLNHNNVGEWVQLADMCIEQNNLSQALSCYNRAIRVDNKDLSLYEGRISLLRRMEEEEENSRKIVEDQQRMLPLFSKQQGLEYFTLALELTKNFYQKNEAEKALDTLWRAFDLHPGHVTAESINIMLELLISNQRYTDALLILVRHCGVELNYKDGTLVKGSVEDKPELPEESAKPTGCVIPREMLLDLQAKFVICCIHLQYTDILDTAMCNIAAEDPEEYGDLYLDVSEAFTDRGMHARARPLLHALVNTQDYNLAAVWLQYAECLNTLGELKEAARAFKQVLDQAPAHRSARVALSSIQHQLGKHDQAISILQQGESGGEKRSKKSSSAAAGSSDTGVELDLQLKVPKCMLLYQQKRFDQFIEATRDTLFGYIPEVFSIHIQKVLIGTRSVKHRSDYFREAETEFEVKQKEVSKALQNERLITFDTLWELFLKLAEVLMELERYSELEEVAIAALAHPAFLADDRQRDLDFLVLHCCILAQRGLIAFDFIRDLVLANLDNNQAWNMFSQMIGITKNLRHNRFCLRLMFRFPDHKALGILNGHNALVAGTYKHALAEYVTAFRNRPEDPFLSFCLGITFVHLASQRFAAKRHSLTVQACAFFNQYLELRGECQEVFYNLGRAMHQLGLTHAAVFYYEKGLECPPMVPEDPKFDLSRELAYNLSLIYKNSGSIDMARIITQKYLVI